MIIVVFYEPQYAMPVEDFCEENELEYDIMKTPVELLDMDVLYCKSAMQIHSDEKTLVGLDGFSALPVAAVYRRAGEEYVRIQNPLAKAV